MKFYIIKYSIFKISHIKNDSNVDEYHKAFQKHIWAIFHPKINEYIEIA